MTQHNTSNDVSELVQENTPSFIERVLCSLGFHDFNFDMVQEGQIKNTGSFFWVYFYEQEGVIACNRPGCGRKRRVSRKIQESIGASCSDWELMKRK